MTPDVHTVDAKQNVASICWSELTIDIWRGMLSVVGAFFCIRYVCASVWNAWDPCVALLFLSGLASGIYDPDRVFSGVALVAPLALACDQAGLVTTFGHSVTLLFCGAYISSLYERKLYIRQQKETWDFAVDGLITIMLASCVLAFGVSGLSGAVSKDLLIPEVAPGTPTYFVTAVFVWLQGLYLVRELRRCPPVYSASTYLLCYLGVTACFYAIQRFFDFPEAMLGFGRIGTEDLVLIRQVCAPFEDIHSFGAVVTSLFAYLFFSASQPQGRVFRIVGAVIAGTLVLLSWSRISWMVLTFLVLFKVAKFAPRNWVIGTIMLSVLLASGLFYKSDDWQNSKNPYLWRLASFVPHAANQDWSRLWLYGKATRIIASHPIAGIGVGRFYSMSPSYALAHDPEGGKPNFAHNTWLQLASEEGVVAAVLFTWIIAIPLFKTIRSGSGERSPKMPVAAAVAAYGLTQLTANSINIYVSNQYFFWGLFALLIVSHESRTGGSEAGSKVS